MPRLTLDDGETLTDGDRLTLADDEWLIPTVDDGLTLADGLMLALALDEGLVDGEALTPALAETLGDWLALSLAHRDGDRRADARTTGSPMGWCSSARTTSTIAFRTPRRDGRRRAAAWAD